MAPRSVDEKRDISLFRPVSRWVQRVWLISLSASWWARASRARSLSPSAPSPDRADAHNGHMCLPPTATEGVWRQRIVRGLPGGCIAQGGLRA